MDGLSAHFVKKFPVVLHQKIMWRGLVMVILFVTN
uniref:Uncharacterized protein n=1 Tax=Anguilla anguilla TaxID=7936 RepID=A0A0E9XZB9_ANGAN